MTTEFGPGRGGEALRAAYTIRQAQVQLSAEAPVRVQPMDVGSDVRAHDHDYYEICVVHGGSAVHVTERGAIPVKAGVAVVIAPGQVHAFAQVRRLRVVNVYYLTEWLLTDLRTLWDQDGLVPLFLAGSLFARREFATAATFALDAAALGRVGAELETIEAELRGGPGSLVLAKACFTKALILLSRAYVAGSGREVGFAFRREVWHVLHAVEDALAAGEAFAVEPLATRLRVSADHLCRLFRAATGMSVSAYYQRRRAQQACRYLLNPAYSALDVAVALGYADAAHFARSFKQQVGVTPTGYRRMYLSR